MEEKELNPQEYFDKVKEKKQKITDSELLLLYDNCLELLNKYKITGQVKGMRKLLFHLECVEKELSIVKMGIDTFVYQDDISEYIDHVSKKTVKIIELENYEREIPDEIVEIIEKTKGMFDMLYVVFTDYTGKVERQIKREQRVKDPILFGVFKNEQTRTTIERFYYLGDWIDEYCDLTLDRMVNEMKKVDRDIKKTIKTPGDIQELKNQLAKLEETDKGFRQNNKKTGLFSKIKTFLSNN